VIQSGSKVRLSVDMSGQFHSFMFFCKALWRRRRKKKLERSLLLTGSVCRSCAYAIPGYPSGLNKIACRQSVYR
jgi:hypothetical protein